MLCSSRRNKGVRTRTSKYSHTNSKNIIYLKKHTDSRGVRDDNIIYSLPIKKTKNTIVTKLNFSKPCICGSLNHAYRTHLNCPLNSRYEDAK